MKKLLDNKKLITIIFIVIIVAIIAVVITLKNSNSNEQVHSVGKNGLLRIKESNDDVSIKVATVDEPIYFKTIFSDRTAYTGVKLSVTNNSNEDIRISTYNFSLIDSNDTELDKITTDLQHIDVYDSIDESKLLSSDIPGGQTVSGYLYFKTDSKDIKRLKVATPTKNKTNNKANIAGQALYFEYYYINL